MKNRGQHSQKLTKKRAPDIAKIYFKTLQYECKHELIIIKNLTYKNF